MSSAPDARGSPSLAQNAGGVLRWVSTNNPFYVLSAGLFLVGIYISFGSQESAAETWALMGGLSGYTLLLAAAAYLIVRFANVWDDARTVLLLVVLMFLATSVTFDFALINNPARGIPCYIIGWLLAMVLSEGLLRGIRLKLPAGFRLPYYLILSLFFVYPLVLRPWAKFPPSEVLEWGLYGFSPLAGLAFLTLIPAIRRGPKYVENNGSPWIWPLYPWSLFGVLALAVVARTFLFCWSMHPVSVVHMTLLIWAPYFLVPFGFALAVLILEGGIVSRNPTVVRAALAVPLILTVFSLLGHRSDPIYRNFFNSFSTRLGGDPLHVTLLLSAAFYGYAALRRAAPAIEGLTCALVALAVIPPDALARTEPYWVRPIPLLLAAVLQLSLGLYRRGSLRLVAGWSLLAFWTLVLRSEIVAADIRLAMAAHVLFFGVLVSSVVAKDAFVQALRVFGPMFVLIACFAVMFGVLSVPEDLPDWTRAAYPLVMAAALAAFGRFAQQPFAIGVAMAIPIGWLFEFGWRGYLLLRQVVVGLDFIVVSFILFAVALAVSLRKSNVWRKVRRET